jgi:ligand-binding sensor domain-containing protein
VDKDGTVWAGTWGGGLARFDGKSWRNYTVTDGLPSNHVFFLRLDHTGRFWVGTSQGLALMKDGQFKVLTTVDGLFANNVFSLAISDRGDLWVGGYGGVTRFVGVPDTR